jgi:hypothetical protein
VSEPSGGTFSLLRKSYCCKTPTGGSHDASATFKSCVRPGAQHHPSHLEALPFPQTFPLTGCPLVSLHFQVHQHTSHGHPPSAPRLRLERRLFSRTFAFTACGQSSLLSREDWPRVPYRGNVNLQGTKQNSPIRSGNGKPPPRSTACRYRIPSRHIGGHWHTNRPSLIARQPLHPSPATPVAHCPGHPPF